MRQGMFPVLFLALLLCGGADGVLSSDKNGSTDVSYAQANGKAPKGAADLPLQALARSVYGVSPDQLHVAYWGNSSYLISWATGDGQVGVGVVPPPASGVKSCVLSGRSVGLNDSTSSLTTGIALTYVFGYAADVTHGQQGFGDYVNLPGQEWLAADYASPILHHALLEGLLPATTYFYQVGDPRFYYGMSEVFNFTTLPVTPPAAAYNATLQPPFRLGVMADVGQTYNTTEMQARMLTAKFDALAVIGDFTYADNYGADGCLYFDWHLYNSACPYTSPEGTLGQQSYQPRWDTWARLWQPILAKIPMLFTNGNHDIEELPTGARFTSYNARYPGPPAAGIYPKTLTNQDYLRTQVQSQSADNEFDPMAAYHNMFYSVEVPGATIAFITSFIGSDTFDSSTVQYQWLERTLAAVNRSRTPWIIIQTHFPMYSSFVGPYKGNECFRLSYEPLFYKYGVDIVLSGHVHSYERTAPVYNLSLNSCGPVHIIVGDGGNNEGVQSLTIDSIQKALIYCRPGQATKRTFSSFQPQACYTFNPGTGLYCDTTQPIWSAYRNPSWGFGVLEITNATTAQWTWDNTDNGSNVTDTVMLTRNMACANAGTGGDRR